MRVRPCVERYERLRKREEVYAQNRYVLEGPIPSGTKAWNEVKYVMQNLYDFAFHYQVWPTKVMQESLAAVPLLLILGADQGD